MTTLHIKPGRIPTLTAFFASLRRTEIEQDEEIITKFTNRGRFMRVDTVERSGRPKARHFYWGAIDNVESTPLVELGDWCHPLFTTKSLGRLRTINDGVTVWGSSFDACKRIAPYEYVQYDADNPNGYRLVVYGAYNAMGLIGSEHNGIALLDNRRKEVIADRVLAETSGWGGASMRQITTAGMLTRLMIEDRAGFAAVMNKLCDGRLRRAVEA